MFVFQSFDPSPVLDVMETMVMVTFHEFSLVVQTGQTNEQLIPLLQLVSSLQTSLLSWAWGQMTENGDSMKPKGIQMATGCKHGLKMSAYYICYIYSNALSNVFTWEANTMNPIS